MKENSIVWDPNSKGKEGNNYTKYGEAEKGSVGKLTTEASTTETACDFNTPKTCLEWVVEECPGEGDNMEATEYTTIRRGRGMMPC